MEWIPLLVAGAAIAAGGCEDDPIAGDGAIDAGRDAALDTPSSRDDADATGGGDGAGGDGAPDVGQTRSYHYVLIEDRVDPAIGLAAATCGVDIDAVVLETAGGTFAISQVHEFGAGSCEPGGNPDANRALGEPEGDCGESTEGLVPLGGEGGYLIASFGALQEIRAGDTITVHACAEIAEDVDERFRVFVGVGTTVSDPNWIVIADDASGTTSATVPALPAIPVE
jgi:hypothetical protein